MHVDHHRGLAAFSAQLAALSDYVTGLDDEGLLAPSRCRGWLVGDVLVHVHLGLQEMFLGLASPVSAIGKAEPLPQVDAASYWRTQPPASELGEDEFAHIRYVRTLFSAIRRPSSLLAQWTATVTALTRLVEAAPAGVLAFQGVRIGTGDFLASWAVECTVHHLDLCPDGSPLPRPVPDFDASALTRETIEELLAAPLPADWSDEHAVLIGTGRLRPTPAERDQLGAAADRLPVLG